MVTNTMFAKPSVPIGVTKEKALAKEPFGLPPAGNDKLYVYVCAVKHAAPFDFQYFDGVDFAKKWLPSDASYIENENKQYSYRVPTKYLSEKQAEAILRDAKKRYVTLPSRPNPDFNPNKDVDSVEYLPAERHCVGDYLILTKAEEYSPHEDDIAKLRREAATFAKERDEQTEFSEKIYQAQGKKRQQKN